MGKNAKDKRDIYYRLAKQRGYRSRSAFKLIQIDEYFHIFSILEDEDLIVDLCSAPGGWSQVCSEKMKENQENYIISIDIQQMDPIKGVEFIKGDITNQSTLELLREYKKNKKVKLVICDGAPDITGFTEFDLHIQSQLIYNSLNFAIKALSVGGTFISKAYKGRNTLKVISTLKYFFEKVVICKPKACRNASFECFILCMDYKGVSHEMLDNDRLLFSDMIFFNSFENSDFSIEDVKFIQVGNEEYDSDRTYNLESTNYTQSLDPLQMPIDPPYKMYIDTYKGKKIK